MDSYMAEEEGEPKVTGVRQVVRLWEILRKWKSIALGNNQNSRTSATTTEIIPSGEEARAVPETEAKVDVHIEGEDEEEMTSSDEDESDDEIEEDEEEEEEDDGDGDDDEEAPADVPKGHLAVYVGSEHRRFIIPTLYLSMPAFKVLLQEAEEEFGFEHQGALTFPCETETFKYILMCMQSQTCVQG